MSKAEDKLNEVKSLVEQIQEESTKRVVQLSNLIDSLKDDISQTMTQQNEAEQKTGTLSNEVKLLEQNVGTEKSSIEQLKATLGQLNPTIEENTKTITELESTVGQLTTKKAEFEQQITAQQQKKATLAKEKQEKQAALDSLEQSIDKDLEKNRQELQQYTSEYDKIVDSNSVWDYLFDKIETPEVEIMAIIAANRKISMDDIKQKAKGVSPVFVGRAISKLEADGKIVNKENLWDLSPSLLQVIE